MQILATDEVVEVFGGEIECTIGTSGANCTGSLSDWKGVYDSAVNAATDAMCSASGNC